MELDSTASEGQSPGIGVQSLDVARDGLGISRGLVKDPQSIENQQGISDSTVGRDLRRSILSSSNHNDRDTRESPGHEAVNTEQEHRLQPPAYHEEQQPRQAENLAEDVTCRKGAGTGEAEQMRQHSPNDEPHVEGEETGLPTGVAVIASRRPARSTVTATTSITDVKGISTEAAVATAAVAPTDEEEQAADRFEWGAPKHVFVLSSAGKPVFSLSGDEQHLSTLMGLIQGMLSLCIDCDGDDLESIVAGNRRFVFLRRGDLILVAVSSSSYRTSTSARVGNSETFAGERTSLRSYWNSSGGLDETECSDNPALHPDAAVVGAPRIGDGSAQGEETRPECESFLRLQLEYMYASILFLLTSKVQDIFRRSPGYDLRGLLGGADASLRGVIELADPSRGCGRLLAGGVETVWMDPDIRTKVKKALQTVRTGALYTIWLCAERVVYLAQPRAPSQRLHSRDLLLLVNFVATQTALRNAESWTPVCFPRFQEKGYLYAYIAFLADPPSSEESTEGDDNYAPESTIGDAEERGKGSHGGTRPGVGDSCIILVSVDASSEQFQAFRRSRFDLESRFRLALDTHWGRYLGPGAAMERRAILTRFCTQMQALHFYYCLRGRRGGAPCVTQCLSSPFVEPLADDNTAQHRIWGHYTRAALRLRRGSCQESRVFCRAGEDGDGRAGSNASGGEVPGDGDDRDEATALFESDPVHSLTYEIGREETVMSLFERGEEGQGGGRWKASSSSSGGSSGERDELHACFPSFIAPEAAYKAATRLMAIIKRDKEWLFLTGTCALK